MNKVDFDMMDDYLHESLRFSGFMVYFGEAASFRYSFFKALEITDYE